MLKIEEVVKTYRIAGKHKRVLDGVSLVLAKGETLSLMGKSGCGKTTLLNIVAGLTAPDHGQVFFHEKKVPYFLDIVPARIRNRHIGFIFQTFRLLSDQSVWQNCLLPLSIRGSWGKAETTRLEGLLKDLGIWEYRNTKTALLSGGQKQRAAIARALSTDPQLILADEPTANLDKTTADEIFDILAAETRKGKSLILVTHEESAARRANRILRMDNGRVEVTP